MLSCKFLMDMIIMIVTLTPSYFPQFLMLKQKAKAAQETSKLSYVWKLTSLQFIQTCEALESIQTSYRFNPRLSRGDIQGTRHRTHTFPAYEDLNQDWLLQPSSQQKLSPNKKYGKHAQHVSTTMFRQDSTWMITEAPLQNGLKSPLC
jgi:hypothetical protein